MEEYIKKIDIQSTSMQTLAFIGDAVYNVYIRCYLVSKSNSKTGKIHKESIKYVSAKAQSKIIDNLHDFLTETEQLVYKRGRNTNIDKVSKNIDIIDYKKATGFETLIGYLYLNSEHNRLDEFVKKCIEVIEKEIQ
ncbi:MAG: Mini-ribonuclease 3 [Clostridia bacterium]|nr:Mini-ribonuclease 3 [Clostridia bacterium]